MLSRPARSRDADHARSRALVGGPAAVTFSLPMIDLHCHVLPGIDDGPRTLDDSVALARAAAAGGVRTIVATPHVSWDYPNDATAIARQVDSVNARLEAERHRAHDRERGRARLHPDRRHPRRGARRALARRQRLAARRAAVHPVGRRPGERDRRPARAGARDRARPPRALSGLPPRPRRADPADRLGRRVLDHRRLTRRALRARSAALRARARGGRARAQRRLRRPRCDAPAPPGLADELRQAGLDGLRAWTTRRSAGDPRRRGAAAAPVRGGGPPGPIPGGRRSGCDGADGPGAGAMRTPASADGARRAGAGTRVEADVCSIFFHHERRSSTHRPPRRAARPAASEHRVHRLRELDDRDDHPDHDEHDDHHLHPEPERIHAGVQTTAAIARRGAP